MLLRSTIAVVASAVCAITASSVLAQDVLPSISCVATRTGDRVSLQIQIPAGQNFELYADRLRVRQAGLSAANPLALTAIAPTVVDRALGHTVVRNQATAILSVPMQTSALEVTYQGCDPVHGVCYLPQTMTVAIR